MRIFASNLLPLFSQLLNDLRGLAPAPIHLYSVGNHFEHFGINAPLVLARILPKLRRESIPIAWARRWRARLKGRAPNRGGGGWAGESEELRKILHRQFRVPQDPHEQAAPDYFVIRNGDGYFARAPEPNVATPLAHLLVANFRKRLDDCSARQDR